MPSVLNVVYGFSPISLMTEHWISTCPIDSLIVPLEYGESTRAYSVNGAHLASIPFTNPIAKFPQQKSVIGPRERCISLFSVDLCDMIGLTGSRRLPMLCLRRFKSAYCVDSSGIE